MNHEQWTTNSFFVYIFYDIEMIFDPEDFVEFDHVCSTLFVSSSI